MPGVVSEWAWPSLGCGGGAQNPEQRALETPASLAGEGEAWLWGMPGRDWVLDFQEHLQVKSLGSCKEGRGLLR